MKMILRLSREAVRYRGLYVVAILSTLLLTMINLGAPKVLSEMTGLVSSGINEEKMNRIWLLTGILFSAGLLLMASFFPAIPALTASFFPAIPALMASFSRQSRHLWHPSSRQARL